MNDAPNGPRDSLVTAILRASDASLQMGFPPRPQIHVFDSSRIEECEGYGGFVECRPYNRGLDASAAIIDLGIIAFALGSTQILMVWEESDLRRSVTGIDSNKHPTGLGLVHATRTDTTLYWNPFRPCYRTLSGAASPIEWEPAQTHAIRQLPSGFILSSAPVEVHSGLEIVMQAVAQWRKSPRLRRGALSPNGIIKTAEDSGYEFRLMRPVVSGR